MSKYSVIKVDCKEADITPFRVFIPIFVFLILFMFAVAFFFATASITYWIIVRLVFAVSFLLWLNLNRIRYNRLVRKRGTPLTATVLGYENDNYTVRDEYGKILRLSIDGESPEVEFYYQLGRTDCPYEVGSKIELLKYKDWFLFKESNRVKNSILKFFYNLFVLSIIVFLIIPACYDTLLQYNGSDSFFSIFNFINEKKHEDLRNGVGKIKFKIPDNYNLNFSEGSSTDYYSMYSSKNNNHYCSIKIQYDDNSKDKGSCNYEEKEINDILWCYKKDVFNDSVRDLYYKYDDDYYIAIQLYTYKENDEFCSVSLDKFIHSVETKK